MMDRTKNAAIHIDRIVVDAPLARPHDAARIEAAMHDELAQLFSVPTHGLVDESARERVVARPALAVTGRAVDLGREIARAIHAAVMEKR